MKLGNVTINKNAVAVGLVFGVGLGLALKSILLGVMFGILFYVALKNEALEGLKKKKK